MTIAPIETTWRGFRFRSRTEARWGVLFTHANWRFEYEPEGFALPSGWYLPDFWLPGIKSWFEVKGQQPNDRELSLARELSIATGHSVLFGIGAPEPDVYDRILVVEGHDPVGSMLFTDIPQRAWDMARGERFDGKPVRTNGATLEGLAAAKRLFERADARRGANVPPRNWRAPWWV